jgi:hypothetical protein
MDKHRTPWLLAALAGMLGLASSGAIVWHTSRAAFTASTNNTGNSWTAATISLADDDTGTAMFTATDLVPGSTGVRCITVTYTGSVATTVKLYGTSVTGTLADDLDLTVEQGTGGGFGSCAGFSAGSTIFTGTLASFGVAATSHATGVGTFAPSTSGQAATYRFTYSLQAATPDSEQGSTASAAFRWEARTS